jgi:biotin carboxyl carrier protein
VTFASLEYRDHTLRYYVTIATGKHIVDVVDLPSGATQLHVDGRPIDVDVVPVAGALSVRFGAQVVDLRTEGRLPELRIVANGSRLQARVESERTASGERTAKASPSHGEKVSRSPMPGRVVKVLVVEGDAVQAGQGLVVLEAMKMENEVRARAAGTVAEVHVLAGTAVEANAKLVTFT